MRYNPLGRTGLRVSEIGLGAGYLNQPSISEVSAMLNRALDLGINYIDTARSYPDSEARIGATIAKRRDEYYLASKTRERDAAGAKKDLETSLHTLRTDWLDLYQLLAVDTEKELEKVLAPGGAYEVVERARAEGQVHHIGITGHRADLLAKALRTGQFETVLFMLSMSRDDAVADLLPVARQFGVGTVVMKPLLVGWLSSQRREALRYVLAHGVDLVVPGMIYLSQLEENVAACAEPVTAEEKAALIAEAAQLNTSHCRGCGYCSPCPQGIDIATILSLHRYAGTYGFHGEFTKRWGEAVAKAKGCAESPDCKRAALCEIRCPYDLAIRPTILHLAVPTPPPSS